ncbi:MAG: hypothetical protein A2149_09460 [Candidatus Schekmanbacteria bacterium RBG_16_38_11]|uniref:DUF507 domain-containing protein n=1 Tax=Candidatus Schekmanbacteria bacterium RBG_16_38_11 TaxID=1817880 RepID=A0A1F7RTF3_9BACT|nr:MAG: hypothetical protein A2149_09460 [Candidatus Schekmanbacteria bacterium RBG_16_38_11]
MKFTQERINRVSKEITSKIIGDGLVENKTGDENDLRLAIVRILTDEFRVEEVIDEEVRRIIASYSRKIPEGSREWEVLYRKHYDEQMNKRRKF